MSLLALPFMVFVLVFIAHCDEQIDECCAYPVESFIVGEFWGPCSCQTLQQKWKRYTDWVQMKGGWIHPSIELNYVHKYNDIDSNNTNNKQFKIYSHEKGIFAKQTVKSKELLFQIPFSITFSQFTISKYIKNGSQPLIKMANILFPKPHHFMPDDFPDWDEYQNRAINTYQINSIRGWLALGLAWLKRNTLELLPWIQLLPSTYYLPFTWNRDKALLTGTEALQKITDLEKEYEAATPYIDILGLTEIEVQDMFALISSRAFGTDFRDIGGARDSPFIPCGVDFSNHNIFIHSSLHNDESFGDDDRLKNNEMVKDREIIKNVILNHKNDDGIIRDIDFASNYLWINHDINKRSQIFINYGKDHASSTRMAQFGFIDEIHPYDHYTVHFDLERIDENFEFKRKYFKTVWNMTYTQQNKTINYDEQTCYLKKYDLTTWKGLGQRMKVYQSKNFKKKENKRKEEGILAPPVFMKYNGDKTIKIHAKFLRFLRLAYLPRKYFDSFTISAILNDFEYDYLENIIDPNIRTAMNNVCKNLLKLYPTNYYDDQKQLRQIEDDREEILNELELKKNRNMTESKRFTESLSSLDRQYVVSRYTMREKQFVHKCCNAYFEPTTTYLKSVKRRKY